MDKASFDTEPKRFESISGETLICTLEVNSNSLCVTLRKEMRYISVKRTIILTILWLFALFDHTFLLPVLLGLIILSRIIFDILDTTEEMLLIVNGLGYQVSSSSMFKQVVEFYPYEKVQNSFINEVILKRRVIYLLSLLLQTSTTQPKLVPLFQYLLPKRDCLEIIYRGIKSLDKN